MDTIIPGALLLYCSFTDIKSREISGNALIAAALTAVPVQISAGAGWPLRMLTGCFAGLFLAVVSRLSRGALGMGDALLLSVTGLYLGFYKNLELLLTGLYISAVFSLILIAIKRKGQQAYPFVPFLFLAFALIQIPG